MEQRMLEDLQVSSENLGSSHELFVNLFRYFPANECDSSRTRFHVNLPNLMFRVYSKFASA